MVQMIRISTPYYLNLAPNYDFIFTPSIYSSRGAFFRYLTDSWGSGGLFKSYAQDKKYKDKKSIWISA